MPSAPTLKLAAWPGLALWFAGCEAMVGATGARVTVSRAALLAAVPARLLTTARKRLPLSVSATLGSASVEPMAPATGSQVRPPSLLSSHAKPIESPLAATVSVALEPSTTMTSAGWDVTSGAATGVSTVSVKLALVTEPPALPTMTRNNVPLIVPLTLLKVSVAPEAPAMSSHCPASNFCHW